MSPSCRCRAGSLSRLLLGAVFDSLLPLFRILRDGIQRDDRRSVGKLLCTKAPHLDQVVDTVPRDAQPPGSVRLCRTFTHLSHASAYNKMNSQS